MKLTTAQLLASQCNHTVESATNIGSRHTRTLREGVIIDDEKTTHFNDFFRCRDVIITSRIDVREMLDHDHDHE